MGQPLCSSDTLIIYPQWYSFSRRDCRSPTSEYAIAQWLEYTPDRWETDPCSNHFSPLPDGT